ncbi:fatty acyl-CoA reductase wat [Aethina tumida]|uniref:fatty acyl-CoA reductase wat n=1 Tax=Aethina tumida TaxID=116153 RepID=UPI002149431B|nr:fatty acyl-CoA reductase wat [Aethina tumida]
MTNRRNRSTKSHQIIRFPVPVPVPVPVVCFSVSSVKIKLKMLEREGGDITYSDMVHHDEPSDIQQFYENSTVFVTGATGFIGRLVVEKLLRVVDNIKIYILVRPKKGKEIEKRLEEIFNEPCFEPLKRKRPDFANKVFAIPGDCSEPDVGLNPDDKRKLVAEVNYVIHCAATVRFDEKLKTATCINVRAVRDLLRMSRAMKNLRAIVYMSTAFSNCIRKDIDEKFYTPPLTGEKLLTLVECLEEEKLDEITPILLGKYPNTYVFTKAIAENVVKEEGKHLPIGIIRPSIIIGSVKEPVSGWIDNFYGATGIFMGAALGLLRSIYGKGENHADMVPADYVVNAALAAVWDVANKKTLNANQETQNEETKEDKQIPIYNYVCTPERPITWNNFKELSEKHSKQIPSEMILWHYFFAIRPNLFLHTLAVFFFQTIPAHIIDFAAVCIGKKPLLVKGYQKINKFSNVISYFCLREWDFKNCNTQRLWKTMKKPDRDLFEFTMKNLSWDAYFYTYVRGARVYLLKDPLETIPKGYVKLYKVMVAHYCLVGVFILIGLKLLMMIINYVLL